MKRKLALIAAIVINPLLVIAQDQPQLTPRVAATAKESRLDKPGDPRLPLPPITLPAGTRIPLVLKQGITTRNAKVGDPVYAQTVFPITQDDNMVIPAGTFVQGAIRSITRPGRVKGRAQLQMSFTSMIFPSGYTIMLPGAVEGTPGSKDTDTKGTEGTIQQTGSKGKDVQTIASTTLPGAGIGAIAGGGKGAGIGAATGGAVGLATVLLTRGPDIQLDPGASVEMVLERNIEVDRERANKQTNQ
jgi:type IV secretion system protein VirB10